MEEKRRTLTPVLLIGGILVGAWLFRRYVFGILLPFLVAWILSRAVKPLVERLCGGRRESDEGTIGRKKRGRLPRGPVAAALVTIMVGGTVYLGIHALRRGARELERLVGSLASDEDGLVATLGAMRDKLQSVSAHIPLLRKFENTPGYADFCARLDGMVASGLEHMAASVSSRLPDAAMAVAEWLPSALIFVTVTLLACYYFCADDGRIGKGVRSFANRILPTAWREALPAFGHRARYLGRQYIRACVWLGCLTFLLCFIGLAVLGIPYAFLLSIVIAFVDFLPLLGAGTVLLPWALVCFLLGRVKTAVGLLVLWGVCTLVRQIAEPRLVGSGLGLHPLASLVAMYAGLRLWGLGGMILAPLGLALCKGFWAPAGETDAAGGTSSTSPAQPPNA